jgi:hypothetical protein
MNERTSAGLLSTTNFWLGLLLVVFALVPTAVSQVSTAPDGPFYIYRDDGMPGTNHFVPSGIMGDTGDITVDEGWSTNPHSGITSIRIQYDPNLKGPSHCDHYGPPCKWAGVYWQEPANNWGEDKKLMNSGFTLSEYHVLRFWARTDTKCHGKCVVNFKVGGIDAKYGDSLKSGRCVKADLTDKWAQFEIDLNNADLRHIIGGFSFSVAQPDYPLGLTLYLDDIRFEKK